jgi:hypothetical protein
MDVFRKSRSALDVITHREKLIDQELFLAAVAYQCPN